MNQKWIKEISYGTLSGGTKNGLIAYEIEFSGEASDALLPGDIADVIELVMKHPNSKCGRVHLTGLFNGLNTEAILSLLFGFSQVGISCLCTLDGQSYPQWLKPDLIRYVTIRLERIEWVPIWFNDLILELKDKYSAEPRMPNTYKPDVNMLYLKPVGLKTEETFEFVQRASLKWNLNVEGKRIKEIIYSGKEPK